ncbi:MAG: hypothetical protein WC662_02065 [Candidatus Paceibacterota bacterium]|jgi:hypothetical protein
MENFKEFSKKDNLDKISPKERFSKFIKKHVLIGAMSIASIATFESCSTDYSHLGSFNSAFKTARENGDSKFIWNDKKYSTKLVDKEFSDTYLESKKFLEDYYNSDYFKSKKVPLYWDSVAVESDLRNKDPRFLELKTKFDQNELSLSHDELQELSGYYTGFILCSDEFERKMDSMTDAQHRVRLINLNKPGYFSMTNQKGSMEADGQYNTKSNKTFVYGGGQHKNRITIPVHELTHKSTRGTIDMGLGEFSELRDVARKSVRDNIDFFIKKYGDGDYEYLTDPTEIDARQNSTRFYLYKKFPGYKAETVFTKEHFKFLKSNYEDLPYDIQQLLDLFPEENVFVSNMNKF